MSTPFFSFSIIPFLPLLGIKNPSCKLAKGFSGEDGIRTHVPSQANGFQDRLVMTTSIPLRILFAIISLLTTKFIIASWDICVNKISQDFQFFHYFSLFYSHLFSITFSLINTETIVRAPANAIITIVTTKSDTLSILSTRPSISNCNIWFSFPML